MMGVGTRIRRGRGGRAILAATASALALVIGGVTMPHAAVAQTAQNQIDVDIPAQDLNSALLLLTQRAGLQIVYDVDKVAGRRSSVVEGRFTAAEALSQMLVGTGLTFRFTGRNRVTLETAPQATDGAVQLGPVRVEGSGGSGAPAAASVNLTSDRAATEGTNSYTTFSAHTASRLPLAPRETPQSVSVITRQQIEDRNFTTLEDAMEVATGVSSQAAGQNNVTYTTRGFSMADTMIDGMPNGTYTGFQHNLAFYDRVEIIRGAAGLVFSAASPGGAVNLIRKRPKQEAAVSAVLRRGSWESNYAEIDASVPILSNGKVRARAVVTYEDKENFIDLEWTKRPAFYGIIEADLGPNTRIHFGGTLEADDRNMAAGGLPRYSDGGDLGLPRSSRGFVPAWSEVHTETQSYFGGIEHDFSDRWNLKVNAQQWDISIRHSLAYASGAVDRATLTGPSFGSALYFGDPSPYRYRSADASLTGKIQVFGRDHELVLGATWTENDYADRRYYVVYDAPAITSTIFDFDPYSVPFPAAQGPRMPEPGFVNSNIGIFSALRLNVADPLKVILGGRLTSVKSVRHFEDGSTTTAREKDAFTPYAGVIYDFAPDWSVYASYTEIFRVQNTLFTAQGEPLPPVTGANYEAGIKGELYGGRLNVSAAAFRVVESNRSQVDPDNPAPCVGSPTAGDCYIAEGKVRGQGFEAEVSGELLPGLEVIAGYTYVDTKYLRDRANTGAPSANEGQPFRSLTPKHLLKVWARYQLPGDLSAWNIGAGLQAQSRIYNQSGAIGIRQAAYALLSARLGYQFSENWSLAVNVENLLDKTYYQRLGSLASGNRYGTPRSFMATLRASF